MADHSTGAAHAHEHEHHENHDVFGFWLYLMTDCILFASLFAVFAVMRNQFAGGPTGKELFELNNVAIETGVLLISSITYGFAMLNAYKNNLGTFRLWTVITLLLGLTFVTLEVKEFAQLIADGAGPDRSAFLSSFFTLVATHGLHVSFGMLWMVVLLVQSFGKGRLTEKDLTKLSMLSLFWHFLDIVWICVFSFVYLMSVA